MRCGSGKLTNTIQSRIQLFWGGVFVFMRASFRKARQEDIAENPDALRLHQQWLSVMNADGFALWRDWNPRDLGWCRNQIEIMEPIGGGIYQFAHHGSALANIAGVSLKGKSTRDFSPHITTFFSSLYGEAITTKAVIYACNESALSTPVHSWQRYLFPLFEDDGTPACVIGLIKPMAQRHDVWTAVSNIAGLGAGTLEAIYNDQNIITDFLILETAGMATLLGGHSPKLLSELLGQSLAESTCAFIAKAKLGQTPFTQVLEKGEDNEKKYLKVDVMRSELGLIINLTDITQIRAARRSLEMRSDELRIAQRMGKLGSWRKSLSLKTITWSSEIFEIFRVSETDAERAHQPIGHFCTDTDRRRLEIELHKLPKTGQPVTMDVQIQRGDGTQAHLSLTVSLERDANGEPSGFLGTVQDISERKQSELQLEQLAYFDPLTNLPNRAMFKKDLQQQLNLAHNDGNTVYVMLIDVDNFKDVNDGLGHAAGDALLVQIARMLRAIVPQRALVSRLGGDEFAIIMRPDFSTKTVDEVAEEIVREAAKPFTLDEGEVHIGISMGIAQALKDGSEINALLKSADLALYESKDMGRGRYSFYRENMSELVEQRLRMARDLKKALAENKLELHYQPQIEVSSGKVIGFEALLRWNHEKRGYISPSEFIPIAESSSLICDLGFWVMGEACRTLKKWMDAGGAPVGMAINVSSSQFWQSSFETEVKTILDQTGVDPRYITLEATESIFIEKSNQRIKKCFANLAELGLNLAIDDFGTGYSSLGYLNEMPFRKLKIDRSFISDVHLKPEKRKLLTGIMGLAHGLGMQTIAEGVEQAEEMLILMHLGCNVVQGFHFEKARPFADWNEMISKIEAMGLAQQAADVGVDENQRKLMAN
jgi:diguanylate cyclase (GGDEF)-like protein/PAS domain S-box-containing protein